jgi:ABC-type transport system involved in multi-copper enzyme maturation permease subunit
MRTWRLSPSGVATVISLEVKQRLRSRKIFIVLGVWLVLLAGATLFARVILVPNSAVISYTNGIQSASGLSDAQMGRAMFSVLIPFILAMSLVVAPAFTASSIASDREQGVLAVLQATRVSAAEIATGKLLASWLVAGGFVLFGTPFVGWAVYLAGFSIWQAVLCFLVMFLEVGLVAAIGLGWSAIASRTVVAVVLTYLSVFVLSVFSLLAFMLSAVFVSEHALVREWRLSGEQRYEYAVQLEAWSRGNPVSNVRAPAPPLDKCDWDADYEYEGNIAHTEYTWWMLLFNPFVVVAEAAPLPPEAPIDWDAYFYNNQDLQAQIKYYVRSAQLGEAAEVNNCGQPIYGWVENFNFVASDNHDGTWTVKSQDTGESWITDKVEMPTGPLPPRELDVTTPLWPWGLASNVLIGAFFFRAAVVRLRVPYRKLAKGVRVA